MDNFEMVFGCAKVCLYSLCLLWAFFNISSGLISKVLDKLYPARVKARNMLTDLGLKDKITSLNKYELRVASQLVNPNEIQVNFSDVAGLEHIVEQIRSNIILPLSTSHILRDKSPLFEAPKGVLLYGPPGCGKTMIAKATAKEANASFINVDISQLTDKWYGESEKLATALFTLADKLKPCIIFIDEIDTFLRSRDKTEHELSGKVKAQFLILWDGLQSRKSHSNIIVIGATNRPNDIDVAILRRMPLIINLPLPQTQQRLKIMQCLLSNEPIGKEVDLNELAQSTDNFSGSDLKELCRRSVSQRLIEKRTQLMQIISNKELKNRNEVVSKLISDLRPISTQDFESTLEDMKRSRFQEYHRKDSIQRNE